MTTRLAVRPIDADADLLALIRELELLNNIPENSGMRVPLHYHHTRDELVAHIRILERMLSSRTRAAQRQAIETQQWERRTGRTYPTQRKAVPERNGTMTTRRTRTKVKDRPDTSSFQAFLDTAQEEPEKITLGSEKITLGKTHIVDPCMLDSEHEIDITPKVRLQPRRQQKISLTQPKITLAPATPPVVDIPAPAAFDIPAPAVFDIPAAETGTELLAPYARHAATTEGELAMQLDTIGLRLAPQTELPFMLSKILDRDSDEYKRNRYQVGVYIISEMNEMGWWIPRYIGMSTDLSTRLSTYASGRKGNPVDRVAEQHLWSASEHERKVYDRKPEKVRREWHQAWMDKRNFQVTVAPTDTLLTARRLELTLIRIHEGLGLPLWNKIKYGTTTIEPFPGPVVL